MKHQTILLALSLSCFIFSPLAAAPGDAMVEIAPAIKMSQADLETLKENESLMLKHQKLVNRILQKEHLERFALVLPKTHIISTNSIHTMLNQVAYTELAHKLGASMPRRPALPTGSALINNRFLQAYNNALLWSIAKKVGCELPADVDLATGSVTEQSNRIIKQNDELLKAIGEKKGEL